MWGRTILDKEGADVDEEVSKAFSCKPCLGDEGTLIPSVSNVCLKWTNERYDGGPNSLAPAFCQTCKKTSLQIKAEESSDLMEVEKHLVEPKAETDLGSNCHGETDLEHSTEGDFGEGEGDSEMEEEKLSKKSSNKTPLTLFLTGF